jgi:cell wall-associated NlpC family hydrolase
MSSASSVRSRLLVVIPMIAALAFTLFTGTVASPVIPKASAAVSAVTGDHAADWARTRKGSPYRYGAAGPYRFDCSGLTKWSFAKVGKYLPHSSRAQVSYTTRVSRANARRGDLVFFYNSSGTVYHVGVYIGYGKVWHAPHTGSYVKAQTIWTSRVFFGRVR